MIVRKTGHLHIHLDLLSYGQARKRGKNCAARTDRISRPGKNGVDLEEFLGLRELVGEAEDAGAVGTRLEDGLGLKLAELGAEPLLRLLHHPQPLRRPPQLLPRRLLPLPALPQLPLQLRIPPPQLLVLLLGFVPIFLRSRLSVVHAILPFLRFQIHRFFFLGRFVDLVPLWVLVSWCGWINRIV
ncbi:hypothetical protein NL676_017804 [Syzygium grande]|nr:hypothetical protein NL676_017804 [Syzygium grande]